MFFHRRELISSSINKHFGIINLLFKKWISNRLILQKINRSVLYVF